MLHIIADDCFCFSRSSIVQRYCNLQALKCWGGGEQKLHDFPSLNSENNNFILSIDSSSNSSDSVNINDLEVTNGVLHKTSESSTSPLPKETDISISDITGLNKLSTLVNNDSFGFLGYTVVLTADLDFNGETSTFNPIGKDNSKQFKGTFDGQGNEISNLQVSGVQYAGLFGYIGIGSTIKNIVIINSSISSTSFSGGIVGYNEGTITGCYKTGGSVSGTAYSGGIAGKNHGIITNCHNTGSALGAENSGGIAGWNNQGTITNCHNTGEIRGSKTIGGIAGHAEGGTIENCHNTGDVEIYTMDDAYSGGIVGKNTSNGSITNCYNTGTVTAASTNHAYSGGIAGDNKGTITNCYNTGNVATNPLYGAPNKIAYSGGIAGCNNDYNSITNCYNTGNVTAKSDDKDGDAYSGGIAGRNWKGTITNCYNTRTVTATANNNAYSGGIAGYDNFNGRTAETVTNCYNTGTVTTTSANRAYSGGIAGYAEEGIITSCYNAGNVTSTAEYAYSGGIAGNNAREQIKNCYNTGNVTAKSNAKNGIAYSGGIAGYNNGEKTIINCYNTGAVIATSTDGIAYSGGIAGHNADYPGIVTIENSFYLNLSINGVESGKDEGTTPLTSDDMKELKLLTVGGNNLNKDEKGNEITNSTKPWSPDIFGVNDGYPMLADVPLSIILSSLAPQSAIYIVADDKEFQTTNYLEFKSVISGEPFIVKHVKLSSDLYIYDNPNTVWEKLTYDNNTKKYNWVEESTFTSPADNETYQAVVTFNVNKPNTSINVGYQYTSLSRTADIKYSVTYDANNGKGLMIDANSPYSSGDEVTILDNTFIAPNGGTFTGWSEKPNPTDGDTRYQAGESITITDQNITLYAVWGDIEYFDVTYNANGGTGSTVDANSPYISGKKVTILGSMFTPPNGKVFAGWSTESGATTADKKYAPGESITITADINLYAVWDNMKYSITYNANNETVSTVENYYSSGDEVTILNNPFIAPEGKKFAGWSTESGATTVDLTYAPGKSITINKNINLYAVWKDIKYSVYYYYLNDNNNSAYVDSTKYAKGEDVTAKDTPVKSGYEFNGWLKYNYGDTSSNPETIQANATFKMPSSDVIMIADWEKTSSGGSTSYVKQYSVIYVSDADISNIPYDNKSYTSGSSASVLKNDLTKEGFISNGWNTKADGTGTQYKEGDKIKITSSNIILYAQFKEDSPEPIGPDTPNSVSVTFYVDDKVYNTVYVIKGSCLENNMPDNPEKQNSTFKGWFYSDSEGNESEFNSESIVNNDMSIYAVFESNQDSNASSLSSSEIIIIVAVIALIAAALILYLFFFRKQ